MAPSWDFALIGGEIYQSPKLTSRQEILDLFDRNVAAARKAIAVVKDDELTQTQAEPAQKAPKGADEPERGKLAANA